MWGSGRAISRLHISNYSAVVFYQSLSSSWQLRSTLNPKYPPSLNFRTPLYSHFASEGTESLSTSSFTTVLTHPFSSLLQKVFFGILYRFLFLCHLYLQQSSSTWVVSCILAGQLDSLERLDFLCCLNQAVIASTVHAELYSLTIS